MRGFSVYLVRFLALGLVLIAACEVSIVPRDGTAPPATAISGSVELGEYGPEPAGDVVLFRYDCAIPPPPLGSGRPVDFVLVPESRFEDGKAEFFFSSVAPETCSLVTGFLDRDDDFHYALDVVSQPSAGDLRFNSAQVETSSVEDEVDFIPLPAPVTLRAVGVYEHDRPSFLFDGEMEPPVMEVGTEVGSTEALRINLLSYPLSTEIVSFALPAFDVVFGSDLDQDGLPDDDNEDGLPDVDWPLIQLQRIQTEDPSGGESSPPVTLPGVVMAVDPESPSNGYSLLSEAAEQGISLDEDGLLVTEEIRIYVPGLVVTSTEPLQLDPIEGIAAAGTEVLGQYRLVVINPDGRLWIVPNELGALGLPSQQVAVELIAAQ
jgi:hypothetical protein